MAARILLIEDDPAFRKAVRALLRGEGFAVLEAGSGRPGLEKAAKDPPDLVILDLGLPGLPGLEVCARLKGQIKTAGIPILILTGNDREGQDISCLDHGADDYLSKPVQGARLLARCRALLRRVGGGAKGLRLGDLLLDHPRKLVTLGLKEYPHLTPKEFGLLYELAKRSPQPSPREALYAKVWGTEAPSEGSLKTVEVHVRRIRLKLGWRSTEWLSAVHGRGYRLAPPD